ncbi:MAG: hypothetical protein ACJAXY_001781 [Nonlabens sp.]|jgi:hypothetical protein
MEINTESFTELTKICWEKFKNSARASSEDNFITCNQEAIYNNISGARDKNKAAL